MINKLKTILRRFKTLLHTGWYKLSFLVFESKIGAFLCQITLLLLVLLFSLGFISCSTVKYVPIDTNSQVIVRDSIIRIVDTVRVEVPKEVIKEVIPQIDTSYLKTSLAESIAYIDTLERKLHHTLTQKGEVKIKYDTVVKVQYVDKIITKEVPVEVVKEVKHIPNWVNYSLLVNIGLILLIGIRLYLKMKKLFI